jgi:hypothetical protein
MKKMLANHVFGLCMQNIRRTLTIQQKDNQSNFKMSKGTGRMTQVVEHLPSKCKALSSYPSRGGREEGNEPRT